jgi:hypoxanthine phosphoribosyltransferase
MDSKPPKVLLISQNKIDKMIVQLANKIKKAKINYDYVVGIARGGLHISKPLSKMLGIPHKSIRISFYGSEHIPRNYPKILDLRGLNGLEEKKLLLIDDLVDQGNSFNWFKENVGQYFNYDIGVLHFNKRNVKMVIPNYFVQEKPMRWIVYPWDR